MGFTYRNPERSTDPLGRSSVPVRSSSSRSRTWRTTNPIGPSGVQARVGRYAWVDHYGPLRTSLQQIARRIRRSWPSSRQRSPTTTRSSIVRSPISVGSGGSARTPTSCSPVPAASSCSGRSSRPPSTRSSEPVADGCGSCRRCLDGCPTGAIVAPGVVDANSASPGCVQQPGHVPDRVPRGAGRPASTAATTARRCARRRSAWATATGSTSVHRGGPERAQRPDGEVQAWVDVLDLLDATDDELLDRFGRWYLADRDPVWWRRNALIVLGNVGDADDERTRDDARTLRCRRERAAARARRPGRRSGSASSSRTDT